MDGLVGANGVAPSVLDIPVVSAAVNKEEASLVSGSSLIPRSAMFCCANMNGIADDNCGIISFACAVGWIGCNKVGVWLAECGCELLVIIEWCEVVVGCIRHLLSSSWSVPPFSMLGIRSSSSVLSRFKCWLWCAFCNSSSNFFFCLTFARLKQYLEILIFVLNNYRFLNQIWTLVSVRLNWRAICSLCAPCGYCNMNDYYFKTNKPFTWHFSNWFSR